LKRRGRSDVLSDVLIIAVIVGLVYFLFPDVMPLEVRQAIAGFLANFGL
jgi:hypothetical protein